MRGADGVVQLGPLAPVGVVLGGATVRITDIATDAQLVGTPPDRGHVQLIARPPAVGPLHDVELAVRVDGVAEQFRVAPGADLAPPPPGYVLLGASFDGRLYLWGETVRVGVDGFNLLNTAYRDYTSLTRYYADQPGLDVRLRLGWEF